MAHKNTPEQETTGIENLNEQLTTLGANVQKHSKKIGLIVAGVVVVALGVVGYIFFNNRAQKQSAERYTAAMATAMDKAAKADPSVRDSIFNATYQAELLKVVNEDAGKQGATLAAIDLAGRYYNDGKYQQALDMIAKANPKEEVMKANLGVLTADCYVNLKKYNEALGELDNVFGQVKDSNPEIAVRVLLKKALVLDEQKKYSDALAAYEMIQNDYPQQAMQMGVNAEAYAERERARLGK